MNTMKKWVVAGLIGLSSATMSMAAPLVDNFSQNNGDLSAAALDYWNNWAPDVSSPVAPATDGNRSTYIWSGDNGAYFLNPLPGDNSYIDYLGTGVKIYSQTIDNSGNYLTQFSVNYYLGTMHAAAATEAEALAISGPKRWWDDWTDPMNPHWETESIGNPNPYDSYYKRWLADNNALYVVPTYLTQYTGITIDFGTINLGVGGFIQVGVDGKTATITDGVPLSWSDPVWNIDMVPNQSLPIADYFTPGGQDYNPGASLNLTIDIYMGYGGSVEINSFQLNGQEAGVPEPETVWMMLAVLASLGVTFRRQLMDLAGRFVKT